MSETVVRTRDLRGLLRRHWLIVTLLLVGVTLRVLTWIAYHPAILFGDSFRYLDNIGVHDPTGLHPIGYDFFVLDLLTVFGGLGFITAAQHVAGVLAGFALYPLARRYGAPNWLAAIAAAPLLLDGYQLQIEQMIMSDAWQQVLLVATLWLLLGWGAPNPARAGIAGLLLGIAVAFRMAALPLIVPALCYLVIAGGAWRSKRGWLKIATRSVALVLGFSIMVGGYAAYFYAETGKVGLSNTTSNVLYGRAAVVADCDTLELTELERLACPDEPLGERKGINDYAHIIANEQWRERFPPDTDIAPVLESFGMKTFQQQPVDIAGGIFVDFLKGFAPVRTQSYNDVPLLWWQFQRTFPFYNHEDKTREYIQEFDGVEPADQPVLAAVMRSYQLTVGYTPGTLLGIGGLIALAAGFGIGSRARASGLRAAALLPVGMAITILGISAAFEFSWRYQLPALSLLPIAGVLGITAYLRRDKKDSDGDPAEPVTTDQQHGVPGQVPGQTGAEEPAGQAQPPHTEGAPEARG
ncbi:dolichyl-phosphate-mannose-protein mannosyltransferase [Tamaricihabitans halophyticus]|uniref:Dolichyl-phosphate-mannose-protein mannosyltransferase n=1 Tax=Tamaricihabitans halophyticus TaxID=1262583 RepID=A0A4R2QXD8_9PSEU|nr:glycosyltransferase family 39 protein [Tamaricihabitans halophyticus]TCP54842.1 dolichyl-phosphate-mannose-protein mannosyltransferase [Tamaricihabitans halophyticus]